VTTEPQEVEIVGLGAQGDGIARISARDIHVPFALPGEAWRLGGGALPEMLRAHPERAVPVCQHFGTCGGCVAQHMPDALYAEWKRSIVVQAFRHRGIEAPVGDLLRVPLGSRRRITVYARRDRNSLRLGFHRAASHDVLDVAQCPIAMPQLVGLLPALREMLGPVLTGRAEAAITLLATPAGIDASLRCSHLGSARRHAPRLATLAARHGLARLTVDGDTVMVGRPPALAFGGAEIVPPPGAFVQAVEASEALMVRLAVTATAKARRVADLFCGLGTFTFPLARRARVLAVDSDAEAIAALTAAAKHAPGLKPIETKVRDLYRMPLAAKELDGFDAVVFDPARSGAQAQAEQLALSKVATVVAVSCNPGTLSRDVRILIDGGYALESVTPIDQFLYAAHVEAIAILRR
jgi:23S rRNA (uracil1939-C5)-methyltransferase